MYRDARYQPPYYRPYRSDSEDESESDSDESPSSSNSDDDAEDAYSENVISFTLSKE